jgi:AhpD family alkylhydroperoxidase
MDWVKFIKDADKDLAVYGQAIPETLQAFGKMGAAAKGGNGTDHKTKELVALGIAISTRCDHCIGYHTRNLVRLEANREEVADVLAVAAYMGGGPSINYGSKALQAFDQFAAQ